ncbi:MAG TPA: flagellin lysine-N-methylase, partial [Telluria sp.]|nr:flagellin lysine-N-methylase [Telluria sp.]
MSILHRTVKFQAIVPRYATRFSCLGPQCEDNCCREWEVPIDRKTRDAYSRSLHPELGQKLRGAVFDPPGPRTKNDDGRLMWNASTGNCFLLKDGLCSVHKELGPTHLSHTCFTYPRHWMQVDGQRQETLYLSCPEAARLALLAPDAFEFVEAPIAVREDVASTHRFDPALDAALAGELRIFCLNLVRLEGLAVWQRLALLGLFCEGLAQPLAAHDNGAVRALLDGFVALLEQGELLGTVAALQPDVEAQALVFSTLWAGMPLQSGSA